MKWYIFPIIALLLVTIVLGCSGRQEKESDIIRDTDKEIPQLEQETETSSIDAPELTSEDDIDIGDII